MVYPPPSKRPVLFFSLVLDLFLQLSQLMSPPSKRFSQFDLHKTVYFLPIFFPLTPYYHFPLEHLPQLRIVLFV